MGLFDRFTKPKWQHKDWKKRLEAVNELDNQEILAEIAKNDSFASIRVGAVKKISDESVLVDIAKNDSYGTNVRREAVSNPNLKNEEFLIDIAKNASKNWVREVAVRNPNLKNEEFLIDIAKNDSDEDVRIEAVSNPNLKNEEFLIDIAKNDSNEDVRRNAVKKISNQSVLMKIATTDPSTTVRGWAIDGITDKSIHDKLYRQNTIRRNDEYNKKKVYKFEKESKSGIRQYYVYLDDSELNMDSGNTQKRIEAVRKIQDQSVLKKIALNDVAPIVRFEAIKRISNVKVLKEIYEKESESSNQRFLWTKIQKMEGNF